MEWSNEHVMTLIDLYRDRPILWNCKLREYKDRNKRHDAFIEIAVSFGVAKGEVERKLKNLICHFSREVKKERDSAKTGTGGEEVYKSKWFAYQSMEFLKDRNRARGMTDTQDPLDQATPQQSDEALPNEDDKENETPEVLEAPNQSTSTPRGRKRISHSQHIASRPKPKLAATDEALAIMRDMQARKSVLRDQYTVFEEQVGMQIRDLPSLHARKVVKHIISNVLFDAEMGKYDYLPTTSLQPSPVVHMYSQPPTFGVSMSTPTPGTSSVSQAYRVPNRVPTSNYHHQQSTMSPAPFTDSCDPGTTDSDSIDALLMEL